MTIKASGNQLAFSEIEAEFGAGGGERRLGKYRRDDILFTYDGTNKNLGGSSLGTPPLDTGIPTSGEIKFSDFYGKKLNLVIDYYDDNGSKRKKYNVPLKYIFNNNNSISSNNFQISIN